MEEIKWYEHLTYSEAKDILKEKLTNIKNSFIAAGYYLKYIRDNCLYQEDGYNTIWEFAEDNYGITRTTASRWMAINDKFSVNGNTPILANEYKEFGKSQLQEMLYLDDKQLERATPEMTKNEIRELRAPKEVKEPLSALGHPRKIYPEDSLSTTPGCDKYTCFSCHHEGCEIRGEECYCVDAPMGNPFPCTTLNVVENLKEDIGMTCQFVNKDLAHHRAGDNEPVPCCKKCQNPCGYECRRSVDHRTEKTAAEPPMIPHKTEEEKCAPAHTEKEPEVPVNTRTSTDEDSTCPPGQSSCPRQEWGISKQQQHEGEKECAKCWNEWKKTQAILKKPVESKEESEQTSMDDSSEITSSTQTETAAAEENIVADAEYTEVSEEKDEELTEKNDLELLKEMLDKENHMLNQMKECFTDKDFRVRKQCIKVGALAAMLSELDIKDNEILKEQPDFPKLKNMEEREEFVLNYRTWPVWIKNELTEETYYRYELPDASAIVVREYPYTCGWWKDKEVEYGKTLFLIKQDTKYFKDGETNMTALKEHLKAVQKGNIC